MVKNFGCLYSQNNFYLKGEFSQSAAYSTLTFSGFVSGFALQKVQF